MFLFNETALARAISRDVRPDNIRRLVGGLTWYSHLRWLRGRFVAKAHSDVAGMRDVCERQMISMFANPLRALLIPISDPVVIPWSSIHEHHARSCSGEDPSGLEDLARMPGSAMAGLLFAGYLKHVCRFDEAGLIYGNLLKAGHRYAAYMGLADIEHLLACWEEELRPYRVSGHYRPHTPIAGIGDAHRDRGRGDHMRLAISLYRSALAERPESVSGRRAIGRALLDAGQIDEGTEELARISAASILSRHARACAMALGGTRTPPTQSDADFDDIPGLPADGGRARAFPISSTRDAASVVGTQALKLADAQVLTGSYIIDVRRPHPVTMRFDFPEIWAASFENARSLGQGILIADDRRLVVDGKGLYGRQLKLFSPNLYRVGQKAAVVGVPPAQHAIMDSAILLIGSDFNYYHWLLETLPALKMLADSPLASDATIFFQGAPAPFQIDSLRRTVPRGTRLATLEHDIGRYWFARINHVQNSSAYTVPNPAAVRMMRGILSRHLPEPTPGKRVYLSRGSVRSRPTQNEKSVRRLMARYGVEYVDTGTMTFDQQIEFFKDVEMIVAPTGAALTNLLFCPDATRVVIITAGAHHFETFTTIAATIGQPCWVSATRGLSRANPFFIWASFDLKADIASLGRCIDAALTSLCPRTERPRCTRQR